MSRIVVFLLLVPVLGFTQPVTDGLVGYWPFDGNADDQSGNGYHGISTGVISASDRNGNPEGALYFDGNSSINFGDLTELNNAIKFSVSLWLQPEVIDENLGIFTKSNDGTIRLNLVPWANGNTYFEINGAGKRGIVKTTSLFVPGEWAHLVLIFDGTKSANSDKLKIYINGIKIDIQYTGTLLSSTADLSGVDFVIGRFIDNYFKGTMDELSLFDRPLNESEIVALDTGEPPPPMPQLCDVIYCDGENVGIGTSDTQGYKLAVAGAILSEEVKVKVKAEWPDFVFADEYSITSLAEVETYIEKNRHLPGIPAGTEVIENGIDLGEMNVLFLQKIEELTLYLIEQNKEIESLKGRIYELESKQTK